MIRIRQSADYQYYFVVKAKNGQTLLTSETYKLKSSCKKAIKSLLRVVSSQTMTIFDETQLTFIRS